ncbi:PrgI family protein, partial [Amycolatopsis sp. cmx-11-12]|uniref:PrgI family protein n=1 Tax=Amycolatopsis sp. cmx-11-12 TaxID=2785795 RepID=UPI003917D002
MTQPVRIPSDVDREDRVLANLTARQLAILAVTGIVLYGAWTLARNAVPLPILLIVAIPIGVTAAVLALGQRDGMSLDRLLLAAIRQRLQPRHRVAAPEGVQAAPEWLTNSITATDASGAAGESEVSPAALRLPAEGVTEAGVVDLGTDGVAMVAVASTVNFALRT